MTGKEFKKLVEHLYDKDNIEIELWINKSEAIYGDIIEVDIEDGVIVAKARDKHNLLLSNNG